MNESTLVPREEMSDLDWLARNLHKVSAWHRFMRIERNSSINENAWQAVLVSKASYELGESWFTVDQWLARRAELQNKPSWEDHPDAKCFVQCQEGWWFKNTKSSNVSPVGAGWLDEDRTDSWERAGMGEVLGDWRDTLEKRTETNEMPSHINQPKQSMDIPECAEVKQFEPFVSVEDAATAKQPAPKGSGNPILGMVLADLTNRALEGKEKYGEPLLAHNGRNPLWDAYQEALDLAMYLRQAIEEQR